MNLLFPHDISRFTCVCAFFFVSLHANCEWSHKSGYCECAEIEKNRNKDMEILQQMLERAQANPQRIVLPEGDEPRTLEAANILLKDKVARLILIGDPAVIRQGMRTYCVVRT